MDTRCSKTGITHRLLQLAFIFLILTISIMPAKGEVIDSVILHVYMHVPEWVDIGFDEYGNPSLDTNAAGEIDMETYATCKYGCEYKVILIEHI